MIGGGELRRAGGGEDVNSIFNTFFFNPLKLLSGIFVLKRSLKKKEKKNGQVLNNPQMRLLLKISGGTFYQIQTDIYCSLSDKAPGYVSKGF